MMLQFVVWPGREPGAPRRLFVYDPIRYDFWYGFHRFIKELP